jgi:hypothetical protein
MTTRQIGSTALDDVAGITCATPTRHLGQCRHSVRFAYVLADRHGERIVRTVCWQHFGSHGPERLLRPFAWEYSYVLDLKTGERMA